MKFFKIEMGPRKEKSAEEFFHCTVRDTLIIAGVYLVVMQMPWILDLLTAVLLPEATGKSDPFSTENADILLLKVVVWLIPLAQASLLVFAAIGIAASWGNFLSAYAEARSRSLSTAKEIGLFAPLLRYAVLWRIFSEFGGKSVKIHAAAMILCSLLFWICLVAIGPLSPLPLLLLAVALILWVKIGRQLTGIPLKRRARMGGVVFLCLWILSALCGYGVYYYTQAEIKAVMLMFRSAGIPTNRAELTALFYHDAQPNARFSALVDRSCDYKIEKDEGYQLLGDFRDLPESKRVVLRNYLDGEAAQRDFAGLEELISSNPLLKYRIVLDPDIVMTSLPHLNFYRQSMWYFVSRQILALERKNPAEAMRLFRLADRLLESALNSDLIIGSFTAGSMESIRAGAVGNLVGSGLLSSEQLTELESRNRGRSEKLYAAIRRGIRAEAYQNVEFIQQLTVPYPEFIRKIHTDRDGSLDSPLLTFLFRGDTRAVPTPPSLWTLAIMNRDFLTAMRHQRTVVDYYDDPTEYSKRSVRWESLYREFGKRPLPLESLILPGQLNSYDRFARTFSILRMSDLALQIERFRRTHGRLPETLSDLGIPLPVDALSGEGFRFTHYARVFWNDDNGDTIPHDFPGWQLSAPGGNFEAPSKDQHERRRDYFTVITQWPLPAPPEPPKREDYYPFGSLFGQPEKQPEDKP